MHHFNKRMNCFQSILIFLIVSQVLYALSTNSCMEEDMRLYLKEYKSKGDEPFDDYIS